MAFTLGLAWPGIATNPRVTDKSYVIEHTADLRHAVWTAVTSPTLTFPTAGTCQWIDDGTWTGGLTGSFRAYRVKLQAE